MGRRLGRLRICGPTQRCGQGAKVGNFVELKKTTLGAGSKANHLSYLGDATIGANVNVGAGTITCNYDGEKKHQTVIEDGAFIGSDTQLIAPVRVGKGAYVAAGLVDHRGCARRVRSASRAGGSRTSRAGSSAGRRRPTANLEPQPGTRNQEPGTETLCAESSDTSARSLSCRSCSTGCGGWSIAATTRRVSRVVSPEGIALRRSAGKLVEPRECDSQRAR